MSTRNAEKRKKRRRRRKVKTSVKLITAAVVLVLTLGTYTGYRIYLIRHNPDPYGDINSQDLVDDDSFTVTEGDAKYSVLNMGQGEAILIKVGNVEALIDTGPADKTKDLMKVLKEDVSGQLEYLVITSPAPGRTGGIASVVDEMDVGTCVFCDLGEDGGENREKLLKCKTAFQGKDMSLDMGKDATLSIIKPEVSSDDERDRSLVTYFTYGSTGFVGLSDAGKEEISRAFGDITSANVVVLSQYGASESNMAIPEGNYSTTFIASASKDSGAPTEELEDYLKGSVVTTYTDGKVDFISTGNAVERVLPAEEDKKTSDG